MGAPAGSTALMNAESGGGGMGVPYAFGLKQDSGETEAREGSHTLCPHSTRAVAPG